MQTIQEATERRDKALKHMGDVYLEMNAPFNENNYEDGFIMDAPDHIIGANKPDRTYVVCGGFAFYLIKREELEEFARGEKTIDAIGSTTGTSERRGPVSSRSSIGALHSKRSPARLLPSLHRHRKL